MPCISEKHQSDVAELRECMIAADPSYAPMLKPPPPWTGSTKTYDDGFQASFVKDWRPQTKAAIEVAFLNPAFEHARAVNALSRVPLKIDPVMADLVERFAPEVMGHVGRQRKADEQTVAVDVADAKWCGDRTFWNDFNCDKRGRVYALQHLNFARADHVRAMLKFANGMKLGGATFYLEMHCANCEGSTDKKSLAERINWVHEHREDIQRIAQDPVGTFDKGVLGNRGWKSADKPFQFVAACRELAAAWADPENFVTHLPVGFDGTANGLQHLALLVMDLHAAAMVNLCGTGDDSPRDVYEIIIAKAVELIESDDSDHAVWWRERLDLLSPKQKRKLLKPPIMTFAYAVTDYGATDQVAEVYDDLRQNAKPSWHAFRYLAKKVRQACEIELPGPASVMDYIQDVAKYCADHDRFLEWTSPSGFPVSNRYQVPNIVTVNCMHGSVRVAQHDIADGVTDQINRSKVLSSAAPNFIHSLDAAHLVKTVNRAVNEGIENILTVHDCFYVLAPQAERLHSIILDELGNLYQQHDPLGELRARNVSDPDVLPVPAKGTLLEWKHGTRTLGQYRVPLLSLDRLKGSKYAFN